MSRRRRSTRNRSPTSRPPARPPTASSRPGVSGIAGSAANALRDAFRDDTVPGLLLALLAFLAFANAWPNTFVFDDKYFLVPERFAELGWSGLARFFIEDIWAGYGADSGLYRPLFALTIAAQWMLFDDWAAGFHLVNIGLHAAVTVLVYRLVQNLLRAGPSGDADARLAAFLATAVFAVHPLHAEVVNSVFNGSELWSSLGVVGGLCWLLRHVESNPRKAWFGLGLIYLLALLCRESAAVLPALAVLLVWLFTPGDRRTRLRRCLPVIGLTLPLAVYLALRITALSGIDAPDPQLASDWSGFAERALDERPGELIGLNRLVPWAQTWLFALKLWIWPSPLRLQHSVASIPAWLAISSHLLLAAAALYLLARRRPALLTGLALFYLTLLPASLFMGRFEATVSLQERYIYLPSVGLTVLLGFGSLWLARVRGPTPAVVLGLALVLLLAPSTWARNSDWSGNIELFQTEYAGGDTGPRVLGLLVMAHLTEGNISEAVRYCDQHADEIPGSGRFAESCGSVYQRLGRLEDAEHAFLAASRMPALAASAQKNLAELYLRMGEPDRARTHFERSIEEEPVPAMKELRKAYLLHVLYPDDPGRRREALAHLARALELQPRLIQAVQLRDKILQESGVTVR